ncbi:MAG: TspO/MBR family protein [Candidatus Daviesbacteria bacterium]|nr:TspO/MBR family protein [Candidatus Daviesbacteria bacterium]
MPKNLSKLILSIGVCLGAGILGSFFTVSAIPEWYATLNKPAFSPPNWIFGPVWTILYILMGIALYLVLSAKWGVKSQKAIRIFAIQLILNTAWSIIFFGMRNPALALVNIVALWVSIFLTIKTFYKINKLAGQLLLPYLAWVSFAILLNLAIVLLNS